jgi:four helix bundle protein
VQWDEAFKRGSRNAERGKEDVMNSNSREDLLSRTKRFALDVVMFVEKLPRNLTCDILGRQLLHSGTSVGADYRAARRAKPNADFISKMGTVEEEADECVFWLELLIERGHARAEVALDLAKEANELVAITVSSIKTARRNKETCKTR